MGCGKAVWSTAILAVAIAGSPIPVSDAAPVAQSRPTPPAQGPVLRLIGDLVRAQQNFDAATLGALTTVDYFEVSPVGELDSRDKMLGFYAPDKKTAAPAAEIREPVVRIFGDTAIVIAKLSYTVQPPGQPARVMEMRATFVARREADRWKLASAHYTGIRPTAK
jgi:ketosteroid isomerase-like protein